MRDVALRGHGSGVGCGVVEWVKRSTPRWFGHIERMENEEFLKKVYLSSVEACNRRGRPVGRREDGVKEYVSERGMRRNGLEWARRECMDIEIVCVKVGKGKEKEEGEVEEEERETEEKKAVNVKSRTRARRGKEHD